MNKDDAELFGILKKSDDPPKSSFVMKLVKVGFKFDDICKKLQPLLEGRCVSVGAYEVPDCTGYVLIWASSKIVTGVRKTITKELKVFLKMSNKMESAPDSDINEVVYKGQTLLTVKSIPASFLMSYVIADVYESHAKKISKKTDFFEVMTMVLNDLQKGHDGKWSDGMSYRDFFKFLEKRVGKFKSKHLSYYIE